MTKIAARMQKRLSNDDIKRAASMYTKNTSVTLQLVHNRVTHQQLHRSIQSDVHLYGELPEILFSRELLSWQLSISQIIEMK